MSAYSDLVASLSPRAYYRLGDESGVGAPLRDSSGNGRDGTWVGNSAELALGAPGLLTGDSDTALTLSGGYGNVAYDSTWMNQPTAAFGVWFSTTATGLRYILTRGYQYLGLDIDAGNNARVYATISGTLRTITFPAAGVRDGQPHLILGRYNGTTLDLFIDGAKVAGGSFTGSLSSWTGGILLGARADGAASTRFRGVEDEVMILPGSITDADVAALWEVGTTAPPPTPTAVWLWSGAATDDGFTVTAKVDAGTSVRLAAEAGATITGPAFGAAVTADAGGYVKAAITGLTADTDYTYTLEMDGELAGNRGKIRTAPAAGAATSFSFAHGSCALTGSNHRVFDAIRTRGPRFFQHMGDLHYQNIATNTPATYQAAYDSVHASTRQAALFDALPVNYVWDDHDFGPDNGNKNNVSKPAAQSVYRQAVPHYPLPDAAAIYHSFQVGRVYFIATDLRSYRDPNTDPAGPAKTMLGATQKAWLKSELLAADAAGAGLIVWLSSNVYNGDGISGVDYDADQWSAFTHERAEIADFIRDNGLAWKTFVVVGDAHMLAHDDGALSDFATGGGAPLPQFCAAALDQVGLVRGDNWSSGTYPGSGQFGYFTFTDDGSTIAWQWDGIQVDPTTGAETIRVSASGAVAPPATEVTFAAVAPAATAALDLERTVPAVDVAFAAVAPAATGTLTFEYADPAPAVTEVTFDATAPAAVGALDLANLSPIDITFAANAPLATASFLLDTPDGDTAVTFAAVAPAAVAAFTLVGPLTTTTDLLSDVSEGYNYDGESDVLDDGSTGSIPAGIMLAPIRFVHQSVPAPVLVKGRPQ